MELIQDTIEPSGDRIEKCFDRAGACKLFRGNRAHSALPVDTILLHMYS